MAVDQRNFGNVLDINGTEVNVEDKRLAELAGQTPKSSSQISTSSQYVPLQDTDGNIVKISPASFQEAVRNTLASLLVNNDKGTSFSQVPVIGSGDFGSASLANLASVLGGVQIIGIASSGMTCSKVKETSAIVYSSNAYLAPDLPVQNQGILLTFVARFDCKIQIYICQEMSNGIYIRYQWFASAPYETWGVWKNIQYEA